MCFNTLAQKTEERSAKGLQVRLKDQPRTSSGLKH